MLKTIKKDTKGFTLIEVMIVLAIAGLIMLVVLLAVPALQRNARNSTMKSDASAVAGAVNEFQGSNAGRNGTTAVGADGTITITGAAGTTAATGKLSGGTVVANGAAVPADAGNIAVDFGHKCNDELTAEGAVSARSTAILYPLETSGVNAPQCLEA